VRIAQILNHLGRGCTHTIVALDGDFSARSRVNPNVLVNEVVCDRTPNVIGMVTRLRALMNKHRPNLVLTYNWGALDGLMAALVPPHIPAVHTEDGFGIEEALTQKKRRVLLRRLLLPHASRIIAPSHVLLKIMLNIWRLPQNKTLYIANGIDIDLFRPNAARRTGDAIIVGTAAQLRPEKRLDVLLKAFAAVSGGRNVRLHIAGDGSEMANLRRQAEELGISPRVSFLGRVDNMPCFYRSLDIFALTSSTEQMPYSLLEATATGLPVLSTDVGDVREMVSPGNHPFVVHEDGLAKALVSIIEGAHLRETIGASNRVWCCERYELSGMLRTYQSLYLQLSNN